MTDYLSDFVQESEERITELNNALLTLEREPTNDEAMESIFRVAHTLKSNCGAMGLEPASDLAHAIEDLLDAVRTDDLEVTPELMDVIFDGVDELETMIEEVDAEGEIETDPSATITALREHLETRTESDSITPPTAAAIDTVLERFEPPADDEHDAYLVRLSIAASEDGGDSKGALVVDALVDAFDLIGTEPPRSDIEADEYDGHFDAVFGSAVGEAAISAGLEPVEEVADFELVNVTDRFDSLVDASAEVDVEPSTESDTAEPGENISSDEAQDLEVDELLDEFEEFDNLDEMVEDVEDDELEMFDNMGDAGSFDDLLEAEDAALEEADESATDSPVDDVGADAEPADAASEPAAAEDDVDDANAVFNELKDEVEMVGFDELQDELDELEFDEFDNDDEVDMDDLIGDDIDVHDDSFFDDGEPSEAVVDDTVVDTDGEPESEPPAETPAREAEEVPTDESETDALGGEPDAGSDDSDEPVDESPTPGSETPPGDESVAGTELDAESGLESDEAAIDEQSTDDAESTAETEQSSGETAAESATPTETADAAENDPLESSADTEDGALEPDAADGSTAVTNDDSMPAPRDVESEAVDDSGDGLEGTDDASGEPGTVEAGGSEIDTGTDEADDRTEDGAFESPFDDGTDDSADGGAAEIGSEDEFGTALEAEFDPTASFDDDSIEASFTDDSADESFDIDEFDDVTEFTEPDDDGVSDTAAEIDGFEDAFDDVDLDNAFDDDFATGDGFDTDSPASSSTSASSESFGDDAVETNTDDDADVIRRIDEPTFDVPELTIPEPSDRPDADEQTDEIQSVRVDVDQIDSLLTLMEGLVTSRVRLRHAVTEGEDRSALEAELDDLSELTTDLQETVMDVRLVPLRTVTNRLPRVVRDISRDQDKDVTFEVTGEDVELDRSILDRIGDPLIHLVRNAVDHGIEPPEEREAAEKPCDGAIEVHADRSRDRVTITVADDGSGLDPDRLRSEALESDVLTEDEAADLSDDKAYDLIFHPGLSTTEEVTDVSGRGVGMDVVKRTIEDLEGTVSIDSEAGEGTTVTMTLPVSVAIDDILFIESGGEEFGVPTKTVLDIGPADRLETVDGERVLADANDEYPVIELDDALETPRAGATDDGMVVRIRGEVRPVALHCGHVHGQQEVVVKPFEGFMSDIPGLSGATVRGRGEVVNILDVTTL
ncbi:Hpt domain-containing protein [Natronorubrum halophilum]|uniref:Hpt domain-containing protein n=1 Tax=Natronorubrum halophilum TaxID=1702106 RepID=UPI000EF6EF2C|nr:Hpt domain-containing protein [Natronorubrum halophilum]